MYLLFADEMSIEELREKYSAAFSTPTDTGTPEQRNSENGMSF